MRAPRKKPAPARRTPAKKPAEGSGTSADGEAHAPDPQAAAGEPGADRSVQAAQAAPGQEALDLAVQGGRKASETSAAEPLMPVPGAAFAELPVGDIHPNRKQPRTVFDEEDMAELVHSVREIGILQPIVVRPSSESEDPQYELVMGERRWRPPQAAGLASVPAIIRSTTDDDLLRDALLENLHRSQLNPLEEAAAYQQLLDDFGCTHDELAERIGRSRPQISNTIRLMKLPPQVQRRVAAGVLTAGHARALLGLNDSGEMEKLAQRIVAEGLSVRSTEEAVALGSGPASPAKEGKPKDSGRHERLDYLANSLADRLDTNVKITLGARKGRVSIEFASVEDLNRIMDVLSPGAMN
ncbi:ParB/RepB/Spo0J family partition protein [Arthrobacter deserti]|uniref:ParB/RepB/Spo0J family partition protein n=1 Tax=Arthrobacter deserti TaxID=1742687 RepID=A0ABX1JS75_9MICC|nr:ParB/RepB/Spo0J family partition protein [Arthrobacter deserti]